MDKEKRIYDLRKKNQELEKFKFVLNYKIQELKRQIMPRKKEIQVSCWLRVATCTYQSRLHPTMLLLWSCFPQDMREQLKEMEVELLQYHKSNAALDLMIGELKLKKEGMQRDNDGVLSQLSEATSHVDRIRADVYAALKPSVAKDARVRAWRACRICTRSLADLSHCDSTAGCCLTAGAYGCVCDVLHRS